MRSLRSPRTSVLRVTAVAASGILALTALTACNGDDDKNSTPKGLDISIPPMPTMPDLKIPDIDVPEIDITGTSTGASTRKPTGAPTADGATLPGQVEAVELSVGECIDASSSGEISKKSCSGPHDAQVAGVTEIPDNLTPGTTAFTKSNDAACEELAMPIIERQRNASELTYTMYSPTLTSWNRGDRTLQCLIVRKDETKLTAKLT